MTACMAQVWPHASLTPFTGRMSDFVEVKYKTGPQRGGDPCSSKNYKQDPLSRPAPLPVLTRVTVSVTIRPATTEAHVQWQGRTAHTLTMPL